MSPTFALLIPVKTWSRAKTRLALDDPTLHRRLVAAFAYDAVAAAGACPAVASIHVVTDEPDFRPTGVDLLPDEGGGDLNAALSAAATRVRRAAPEVALAALCADVPCLTPEDLGVALAAGSTERWFVADAAGTGTTMLAATGALEPHFGVESAARHRASGAMPVSLSVPTLRRDVDTADDLVAARRLGVGARTAAALHRGNAAAASWG